MSRDIFCDIKKIRENFAILQENNYATIIIDQNQSYKGHLLIIPDKHSANISQVDEITWKEGLAPLIAYGICQLRKNPEIVGFHLNTNAGRNAHQSVFHTHIHLVPQYKNGGGFKTDFQKSKKPGYQKFEGGTWQSEESILKACHEAFKPLNEHLQKCENENILTRGTERSLEHFHIFARIDKVDGGNYDKACFHFIPNPDTSEYNWMDGFSSEIFNLEKLRTVRDKILGTTGKTPDRPSQENPTPPNPNQNGNPLPNEENNQPNQKNIPHEIPNDRPSAPNQRENSFPSKNKEEIAKSDNWEKWSGNYNRVSSSTELQEQKKQLEEEFLNSLIKIIGNATDLIALKNLESNYQKHEFYIQNPEMRETIDDFCHSRREELEKLSSHYSHQPKSNNLHNFGRVTLVILLTSAIIFFTAIYKAKKKKHKKSK